MGCNSIVQKTPYLLRFITSLEIQKDRQAVNFFMAAFPLLLLGICFWREGFEAAFGPERRG
jgi:hypothetical protein